MLQAGVSRTDITPFHGVELTGWGYYIERRWTSIRDRLQASALAITDGQRAAIVVVLDLMVIDTPFTTRTRHRIRAATGVDDDSILLCCSHTHNAPAAGGLLGAGACDPFYEDWASRQAVTAAVLAWTQRQPATIRSATTTVDSLTFNRTRVGGVVDPTLTLAAIEHRSGAPMAVLANFAAHPTVGTELNPWAVSRDVPGELTDHLEQAFPGAVAMHLQGACGDVNFHRSFTDPDRRHEPAKVLADAALKALECSRPSDKDQVATVRRDVSLPTRRWTEEELLGDRNEALRRLRHEDFTGWREGFGRAMTNRPDDMVRRHAGDEAKAVRAMCRFHLEWTDKMLADFGQRPEVLSTEVQGMRLGNLHIVANASECFAPFALDVRRRDGADALMVACYANGRIGYLPDTHDIAARSYAAYQSPKYCDQFPFTEDAGPIMCDAMVSALNSFDRAEACR